MKRIVFVTTNHSWGGSEELWSRTARDLVGRGHSVAASIGYPPSQEQIVQLAKDGVDIHVRPTTWSLSDRVWANLMLGGGQQLPEISIKKFLNLRRADLVVISDGVGLLRAVKIMELCMEMRLRFAAVSQLNGELFWPDDGVAGRLRTALDSACGCYFVSESNRRLFERQIGQRLPKAEVVSNPFNLDTNSLPPWPDIDPQIELRFASVARLEPLMKGQDIILEALSCSLWTERPWQLTFYGDGPMQNCIERLAEELQLKPRVNFAGYVSDVRRIWAKNHVLVLPSRYEGMPLALVEAMLCSRPAIATNVGGNAELIRDGETGFLAGSPTTNSVLKALEHLWSRRGELRDIGAAAATSIRRRVPSDPPRAFADKLCSLC